MIRIFLALSAIRMEKVLVREAIYLLRKIIKDIQFKEQDLRLRRHIECLKILIIGFYIEEDKEMITMAKTIRKNKTQKEALIDGK